MSDCPHCDHASFALEKPLLVTDAFNIVCDVHPLIEGHILIIPKEHISCAGAFSEHIFAEFLSLYQRVSKFVKETYGSVNAFEHGILGQTVFHAHVHILPYNGDAARVIQEGMGHVRQLRIDQLREAYQKEGKYLFFSIENDSWLVDVSLGKPRFFRERFAKALGVPEREDWKSMQGNASLMEKAECEIESVQRKWRKFCGS
ncbi:MAG: HIT family protein [Patescibacteria group bacterium]